MKIKGVNLGEIQETFVKLSEAVDTPLASPLVQ